MCRRGWNLPSSWLQPAQQTSSDLWFQVRISWIYIYYVVLGQNLDRQNLDRTKSRQDNVSIQTKYQHGQNINRQNLDATKPRRDKISTWIRISLPFLQSIHNKITSRHGHSLNSLDKNLDTFFLKPIKISILFFKESKLDFHWAIQNTVYPHSTS